jgi:tRNA-dihydrouridine synthase
MGCPAHNIMRSGGGAELIKDKQRSLRILKSLHDTLHIPFSIKTRAGLTNDDKQAQLDFLLDASAFVHTITLHGRTVSQ